MNKIVKVKEETIISQIYLFRGEKVMLDSDLALLYGVSTSRLNEQVKRNNKKFPADFMFQLTWEEYISLKSQVVASNSKSIVDTGLSDLKSQNATSKSLAKRSL